MSSKNNKQQKKITFAERVHVYRVFGQHYGKQRFTLMLAFIGMLGSIAATLLLPWPLKLIIDHILLDEPFPTEMSFVTNLFGTNPWVLIFVLGLSIIFVTFLNSLFSYIHSYYFAKGSQQLVTDVRQRVFGHLQAQSLSYFKSSQSGDVVYRLTSDIQELKVVLIRAPWVLVKRIISVSSMLVVMSALHWQLTLVAVAIIPFIFLYSARFGRGVKKAAKKRRKKESKVASIVSENITAMALVQAYGQEETEKNRFDTENRASVEAQVSAMKITKAFKRLTKILVAVGTAAVVYYGALSVLAGTLLPGTLIVFVTYLKKLYSPIDKSAETIIDLNRAMVSTERVLELVESSTIVADSAEAVPAPLLKGGVEFDNVTFSYNPETAVIQNLSLVASPGKTVALVGHSGAGKSTLLNLLMRFYEPQNGRVLVDGQDVKNYTLKSLRDQITLVFQDAMLLRKSIAENIAYGRPDATRAEIVQAAQLAQAHEFIMALPDGYNTLVEEGGENFSGGQKQRISIARAMLRDTPILILDEPTTGLDARSETKLNEALGHLMHKRTTFVIAHRFATILAADKIVLLDSGKIAGAGSHSELMQSCAAYQELYNLQFGPTLNGNGKSGMTVEKTTQVAHSINGGLPTEVAKPEQQTSGGFKPNPGIPFAEPLPHTATVEMHGTHLQLNSNSPALTEYMQEHVYGFTVPQMDAPQIIVNVFWLERDEYDPEIHKFHDLDQMDRIGKRVLGSDNQLVWLDLISVKGLQLRFRLDGDRLTVDAIYRFNPKGKQPNEVDAYRYKRTFSLMKYFVYFPLIWHLEQFQNLYLLHASAVMVNGKAVVIAGVGGVGKTTTSMALLALDGAQLISENLIFYDDKYVYSCYEPLRADDGSVAMLGKMSSDLRPGQIMSRLKEKNLFHVARERIVEMTDVSAIFVPKFGRETAVSPLNKDICVEQLLAMNMQTREVNAYYWFAATLQLLWPKGDRAELRGLELTELISKVETYELSIDPRRGVAPVIQTILERVK